MFYDLKNSKTEKAPLNTIKARKLKFFGHTKRHDLIMKRQDGGQNTTRQASSSVVRQHQGAVRAQLSRMYEIGQSERDVAP
ncbi:hypothetical protein RRG08_031774 [Elysia crispata]|uniref:Uncharacterized protein n=1 Tax=Elysia crispata TaxID=231223 RepID=A0AAE1ABE8_9GAST|nr:hypothetical protein RRG08_031774 [Elysia crispata]